MSAESDGTGPYFIYALIDPRTYLRTKDALQSIFYVGKGTGSRARDHEKDVRKALRDEEHLHERLDSKAHRIHQILDRGERIPILYLAEGISNSADAYQAEQLAMTLVDGLVRRTGAGVLTNAIPGHGQGVRRVGASELGGVSEWEQQIRRTQVDIGSRRLDLSRLGPTSAILVKGTRDDLPSYAQRLVRDPLPEALAEHSERIRPLEVVAGPSAVRRGWDPDDRWDDEDAQERGHRYWQFGMERVAGWLRDPEGMPRHLLLGVGTPSGETVVRYAWTIDREGPWEFFPESHKWGVPIGKREHDHPLLEHALYETKPDGQVAQVLQGRAAGWRHIVC